MRAFLPLIALLATGCYAYVPVGPDVARRGERVRAKLTQAAATEVGGRFNPGVAALEGILLNTATDEVSIAVHAVRTHGQGDIFWNGEAFQLQPEWIASLEQRQFSWQRSAIFAAGIVLGAYLMSSALEIPVPTIFEPGEEDPVGPEEIVVPAYSGRPTRDIGRRPAGGG